jgi:CRP-like cAMP-binding protein
MVLLREIPRGGAVMAEVRGFFVCAEGEINVFKTVPDGREQILHFVFPCENFVGVGLVVGQSYPASAQVLEAVVVPYTEANGTLLPVPRTTGPGCCSGASVTLLGDS